MIMTITEYVTMGFASYLIYVSLIALHWQHPDTVFKGLCETKSDALLTSFQNKNLTGFCWGVGYVGTNFIFNSSGDAISSSIEMMWRIAHLVVTFSFIRDAQVYLLLEKCQRRAFVIWYNPKNKSYF